MDWSLFPVFFAACFAAASTGRFFSPDVWYTDLRKPAWTPPNWLFPVAWTVLYILIALAAARAAAVAGSALGLGLWALQMTINALWSPIVFGKHKLGAGAVVVAALWLAVAATMLAFFRLDPVAGWLFVPYLAWVSVATALNVSVWRLNKS